MKLDAPLVGDRIVVRNYTPEDLVFSTGMWFDPVNGRYLSDPEVDFVDGTYQKALDGLQDSGEGYYLVAFLGEERVGTCCLFPDKAGEVWDIGYCIHQSRWRQGFGTELVELMVEWVRKRGGSAVTAEVAKENPSSRALLEKCGFTAVGEGSFRKYNMAVRFDSLFYEKRL